MSAFYFINYHMASMTHAFVPAIGNWNSDESFKIPIRWWHHNGMITQLAAHV